ncbi:hypothetical protein ACJJTC_002835 [Scirpophaga incertulas]
MSAWKSELTCKPLNSYSDILLFLQHPPPWRTLCQELQQHSKYLVRNIDLVTSTKTLTTDYCTDTFCHVDPDTEDIERHADRKLPKTLVCHDMANGYHDDSLIDGSGNYDAYTFYNWAGIDIFCYFSHHLITIPPLGWINVGHAHGVKVIGTVITEWADGMAFWDKVLKTEQDYKNFATALVSIAKILKFDGWLLNVENKISNPEALLKFVKVLHESLHRELPHAVLIWYDSVTVDGNLSWQNGLNHKNKPFFDVCDGLFTNYSWSEEHVRSSSVLAGGRLTDLYIGLDVWGRNFFGGGQFNLHEAVKIAHRYGCSMAVFAPAWSHEAITMDADDQNSVALADGLDKYAQFLLRDRALWGSIWRYLNTRVPCQLPFKTSFCRGQGKKRYLYGEVLCPVPWFNLRHMQYQPNSSQGPHGYALCTADKLAKILKDQNPQSIPKDKSSLHDVPRDLPGNNTRDIALNITAVDNNEIFDTDTSVNEDTLSAPYSVKRKMGGIKHSVEGKTPRTKENEDQMQNEEVSEHDNEFNRIEKRDSSQASVVINKELDQIDDSAPVDVVDKKKTGSDLNVQNSEGSVVTGQASAQTTASTNLAHNNKIKYVLVYKAEEVECLEVYFDDSFIGGSCLKLNPCGKTGSERRLARLLHCDFFCAETLAICVVTKNLAEFEDQFLNITLNMKDERNERYMVKLIGHTLQELSQQELSEQRCLFLYPLHMKSLSFRYLQRYLLLNEPGFYVPVENCYNWVVRYYLLSEVGSRVTSISCATGLAQGPILLGHLTVCSVPHMSGSRV